MKLMRIVMICFYLLITIISALFVALNAEPAVLHLYVVSVQLPLAVFIVIAFMSGLLVGLILSIMRRLQLGLQISKLKNNIKLCEQEIKNLRDIPLKD